MVNRSIRTTLILAILLIAFSFSGIVHAQEVITPDLYTLQARLEVSNVGDTVTQYVRVRMPLLTVNSLYGTVVGESYNLQPDEVLDTEGGRIGVFYIRNLSPGASFALEVNYTIDRSLVVEPEVDVEVDLPIVTSSKIDSEDHAIIQTTHSVIRNAYGEQAKVQALLDFVHNHIRYDLNSTWRNSNAVSALTYGEGVCEDYAALFVSMARASGIESRMVYGYYYSNTRQSWERHAWAEYRLTEGDWVSVDPTFGTGIGLGSNGVYIAQSYSDTPIRMGFLGGRISAGISEDVRAAQ